MFLVESIMTEIAHRLGKSQDEVRALNFYKNGDEAPYGQIMKDAQVCSVCVKDFSEAVFVATIILFAFFPLD